MNEPDEPERNESTDAIEVPHTLLSPDALLGLVESFVLREGTDYGDREFTHEQKVAQVMEQLESGDARIVFDPDTESVTLLLRD
ncbi:MAG: YheU family protein [Pseudomonadota bacterium]